MGVLNVGGEVVLFIGGGTGAVGLPSTAAPHHTQLPNGMFEANFTPGSKPGIHFDFRRWRIEPYTSFEFPEEELVRYKGRFLRPDSFMDEVFDDQKRGRTRWR